MNASPITWGTFDPGFLDVLAAELSGKRVLEIFAGNGYLASQLKNRGIDILPTTLFASHDGHSRGMYDDVLELEASQAVETHGSDRDVLLMSWPTSTNAAVAAALRWGTDRPIVFIGEVTDHEKNYLGGCASDLFFELIAIDRDLPGYSPRNVLERAMVVRMDPQRVHTWANPDSGIRP